MINCFPSLYQDELLYSLFARYYVQSGYTAYIFVSQDLYENRHIKPSVEFINKLSDDVLQILSRTMSIETLVEKHTMFPQYARFLDKEHRDTAFSALINMNEHHRSIPCISISKNKKSKYLRYCPKCSMEDREKYGETYWHRCHQLVGVNICAIHLCKLKSSEVVISSTDNQSLITAEEVIPLLEDVELSENQIENRLSKYITDVFCADVDFANDIPTKTYLRSKLEGTKYLSTRGGKINLDLLYADFMDFYSDIPDLQLEQRSQLIRIFCDNRYIAYKVCMLAMFLDIHVSDLVKMKLPEKLQPEKFDEKFHELHEKGESYSQIAKQLNVPYSTVKIIGKKRYGKVSSQIKNSKCENIKKIDYE